jgi:hypothetical protein
MLFNTFVAVSIFGASALGAASPAPYKLGKMSINSAFGLMKRQAGYQPTQTFCGPGADCAASCGAGYVQCPSTDSTLHCFDPDVKQSCCPDGTGNSCDDGYYCTSLSQDGSTWCCPNGMTLAQCAAAYSLTGSLVSETPTASASAAASTSSSSSPASVSVTPTSSQSSSTISETSTTVINTYTTTTTSCSTTSSASLVIYKTTSVAGNVTVSKTTTSALSQFTGGANVQAALGALPALAFAAAGAMFAL